jgi:hypothetical protein
MSDGFQVVMADLLAASATFHTESAAFEAIMPDGGPPCPDGGDGAFNQNLQVVTEMIGTLHHQAAAVMDSDSTKLKSAHDRYANTEESLTQLCNQISDPAKIN